VREYSKVLPRFWNGDTGKQLRGDVYAQLLAAYLMTCNSANMLGLYYLPLPTLEHEIGINRKASLKALRRVSEVGFAHYDPISEYVFVVEMARIQVGESLKAEDNRVKGIEKELETHRKSPFFNAFLLRYAAPFCLSLKPKPGSLTEAPSKALRSQEQEQEQEQEKKKRGGAATPQLSLVVEEPVLSFGEFGLARMTQAQHGKLKAKMGPHLDGFIRRFDHWVHEAPEAKANGVKRKERHAYESIGAWFERDLKDGKLKLVATQTGHMEPAI
jgi:hypothetical protein